jgi:hypothetical protein
MLQQLPARGEVRFRYFQTETVGSGQKRWRRAPWLFADFDLPQSKPVAAGIFNYLHSITDKISACQTLLPLFAVQVQQRRIALPVKGPVTVMSCLVPSCFYGRGLWRRSRCTTGDPDQDHCSVILVLAMALRYGGAYSQGRVKFPTGGISIRLTCRWMSPRAPGSF